MRRSILVAVLLIGIAVVATAAYWYLWRPSVPSLTAGAWTATVTTIAGRGEPGVRDANADVAEFSDPFAVAIARDGRVIVADAGDSNRIRVLDRNGVTTIAGAAGDGYADGPPTHARFSTPSGVAIAADGALFVADTGNHRIRRIAPDGEVSTVAGSGIVGLRDGRAMDAQFNGPIGVAILDDNAGVLADARSPAMNLFRRLGGSSREENGPAGRRRTVRLVVADTYNDALRLIDTDGRVTTIAGGSGPGYSDGNGPAARFDTPCGVAMLDDRTILVADTGNGAIRQVTASGEVRTVTLLPIDANSDVSLIRPVGIAAYRDRTLYVTDRRGRILQVLADGHARVLAGGISGFSDGGGPLARFHNPTGLAVDAEGALVVADAGNYVVRRVAPAGLYDPDPPRSPLAPSPGLPTASLRLRPLPWPVDPQFEWHELAGNMGEARGSLADARERFHAGIDVHAAEGTIVRAIATGKVDAPLASQGFDTLTESVSVGPFTYVHIRVGRERNGTPLDQARAPIVMDESGRPVRVRVRRGTKFELGEAIGSVNRFNHVHLNVGSPGREVNPLLLPLVGFDDTVPPVIVAKGILLFDETGSPIRRTGRELRVSGRVRIVVDAYDRVDGNTPRRRLGVFRLGYQLLHADRTPVDGFEAPRITIDFTRLPQDPRAPALVYAAGSGIPEYGTRRTRFLYTVTNTIRDGIAEEGWWDTTGLDPGPYVLRIHAEDSAGNVATSNRDLRVSVSR